MKESYLSEKYLNDYQEASRVIIAGGRDFDDYEYMSTKLNELFKDPNTFNNKTIKVISGMARKSAPFAGFLRNNDMLSIATHLIAFWDRKSNGTKHMIEIAQMKGIPVWVFEY